MSVGLIYYYDVGNMPELSYFMRGFDAIGLFVIYENDRSIIEQLIKFIK